jgi:hypothetical protein
LLWKLSLSTLLLASRIEIFAAKNRNRRKFKSRKQKGAEGDFPPNRVEAEKEEWRERDRKRGTKGQRRKGGERATSSPRNFQCSYFIESSYYCPFSGPIIH